MQQLQKGEASLIPAERFTNDPLLHIIADMTRWDHSKRITIAEALRRLNALPRENFEPRVLIGR